MTRDRKSTPEPTTPADVPPRESEADEQRSGRPQPAEDHRERTENHQSGYGGAGGKPNREGQSP
jgi:hypothetical protein